MNNKSKIDLAKLYGSANKQYHLNQDCPKYELSNETGTGTITVYEIIPGIRVAYNDIHMAYCNQNQKRDSGIIEINHCQQGRYECQIGNKYCYMSPGDFSIGTVKNKQSDICFPLSHYHGISIFIEYHLFSEGLNQIISMLEIDMDHIIKMASYTTETYVIRASQSIEHIFSELYSIRERSKPSYLKVKVLELLLFLNEIDIDELKNDIIYLSQIQVEQMKKVQNYLLSDIRRHDTIEELSHRFEISPTVLKTNFKKVYGTSIYAYLKGYRMQTAGELLTKSEMSIADIAAEVGYENPNKFATAFHKEYLVSPTEYKKQVRMDR